VTSPCKPHRPKRQGPTPDQVVRAVVLCFIDDETDEAIAAELGVCRRTLARWKHLPEFAFAEQIIGELTFEQTARTMVARRLTTMGGLDQFDRGGRLIP